MCFATRGSRKHLVGRPEHPTTMVPPLCPSPGDDPGDPSRPEDPRHHSRRAVLKVLAVSGLIGLAGCSDGDEPSSSPTGPPTSSPSPTATTDRTDSPTATATEAGWVSAWVETFDGNVVALDERGGQLFATVSDDTQDAGTRLYSLTPDDGAVRWRAAFDGEAFGPGPQEPDEPDDGWGTWLTPDRAYLVTGRRDEWHTVRAVDRASGTRLWSARRERELAVRGIHDGTVYATGREYFVPETTHDTPEDPLVSVVYALDAWSGEARWTDRFRGVADVGVGPAGVAVVHGTRATLVGHDGERRWTAALGGGGLGAFVVGDRVLTVSEGGRRESVVRGFTPDGDERWRLTGPDTYGNDMLLDGERLHLGGRRVLVVEPDGAVAWRDDRPGGWFLRDPATGRVYTRAGRGADAVRAYDADGRERWVFDPPSDNAWPATFTDRAVIATAITGEHASEPFYTTYVVDRTTGEGTELTPQDTIFSMEGVGERVYMAAGRRVHVFEPP